MAASKGTKIIHQTIKINITIKILKMIIATNRILMSKRLHLTKEMIKKINGEIEKKIRKILILIMSHCSKNSKKMEKNYLKT